MNQNHIWRRVRFAIDLALHGDLGRIATILRRKTWSTSRAIGLIRDLDVPFQTPDTRSPVSFWLMRGDDVPKLLDLSSAALSIEERRDRIDRLHLLRSGFDTCFVVVDEHDHPCSMEWMIRSHENALLTDSLWRVIPSPLPRRSFARRCVYEFGISWPADDALRHV